MIRCSCPVPRGMPAQDLCERWGNESRRPHRSWPSEGGVATDPFPLGGEHVGQGRLPPVLEIDLTSDHMRPGAMGHSGSTAGVAETGERHGAGLAEIGVQVGVGLVGWGGQPARVRKRNEYDAITLGPAGTNLGLGGLAATRSGHWFHSSKENGKRRLRLRTKVTRRMQHQSCRPRIPVGVDAILRSVEEIPVPRRVLVLLRRVDPVRIGMGISRFGDRHGVGVALYSRSSSSSPT